MTHDPRDPVLLKSVPSETEAAALVLALKDYGIDATTTGGYTASFRAETPGDVQIIIQSADLDRARIALEEIERGHSEMDWSDVDVGRSED